MQAPMPLNFGLPRNYSFVQDTTSERTLRDVVMTPGGERDFRLEVSATSPTGGTKIQMKVKSRTWKNVMEKEGSRGVLREVLRTAFFDNLMCTVVVANAFCMASEQAARLAHQDTSTYELLENVFLAIYTAELGIQFFAFGLQALSSNWIRFDILLVIAGIASLTIKYAVSPDSSVMVKFLVMRMVRLLRLARLARTVRLVVKFKELWMLARGLLNSVGTAFHTLLFGLVLLFVIGCMTVELIPLGLMENGEAGRDETIKDIVDENFSNLPATMLTLVQFITFDNVVYLYKPLIEEDASLALFFIVVLLLVGVVFMNLVTAIIVNSGLEQSVLDRNAHKMMLEEKRKHLLTDLEAAFHRIDTNSSGTVSRRELSEIDQESLAVMEEYLGVENLPQLFDVLDVDGDGEIAIEEFCDGITSIVLTETQPEIKRIERLAETVHKTVKRCEHAQTSINQHLVEVIAAIDLLSERFTQLNRNQNLNQSTWDSYDATAMTPEVAQMPDWVTTIISELKECQHVVKETCTKDIQRAMSQAFAGFMAQDRLTLDMSDPTCEWEDQLTSDTQEPTCTWEALPQDSEMYLFDPGRPTPQPRSLYVPPMLSLGRDVPPRVPQARGRNNDAWHSDEHIPADVRETEASLTGLVRMRPFSSGPPGKYSQSTKTTAA